MCTRPQVDHYLFGILLYRKNATELLVQTAPNGLRLPSIAVPRNSRFAEEITAAIKDEWNLETYCLFPLLNHNSPKDHLRYHLLETCDDNAAIPAGMEWFLVESLSSEAFEETDDYTAIKTSLTMLEQYRSGQLSGPFGTSGWLQEVREWTESQACAFGLKLSGKFRQLNASPTFSLIRFETDGPALWFKAVSEPNLHEYPVTLNLASRFPEFLPPIVASDADWNAWLSLEAEGIHPNDESDLGVWMRAARTVGELQLTSIGHGLHLIEAGCRDVRPCSLLGQTEPFFEAVTELMKRQTKKPPAPLSPNQLSVLRTEIEHVLEKMLDSEVPTAVGHLDFNPGNILVAEHRCVFLDWAEACVGHPFLTFEYLKEQFRKLRGATGEEVRTFTAAFAAPWQQILSAETLESNLELAPLLAAFAYAVSLDWQNPENTSPTTAVYLRSLVRRMQREADLLRDRRILCVH